MKKKIALVLLSVASFLVALNVSAQGKYGADSAECIKYLSYYAEYFKQKNYKDAIPNWRKAYNLCPPTASQNMLIHGSTMMQQVIGSEKDEKVKAAMVDTLLTIQDQRAEFYPKYADKALNNKGLFIAKYIKDPQRLYDEYNKIIEANQEKTISNVLLLDLQAAIDLFKDNKVEADAVIGTYQKVLSLLEKAAPDENNEKVKADIEGLFVTSQVASCENLLAMFTPRYEADPDDAQTIRNIVSMLSSTEGCQDNDLFLKAVTKLYQIEPSASSAYYLYKLYSSHNDVDNAIKYIEEAINSEDIESKKKADYCVELATFALMNSKNAMAFDYAKKAAELDESTQGKAYYIIGTIWGSVVCSGNDVEKRAHFWVAVDYLQKAKAADSSLTDDCNKLIGQYSVYYPEKADAFMYDVVDGQKYTVNCSGMSATTTVRTR